MGGTTLALLGASGLVFVATYLVSGSVRSRGGSDGGRRMDAADALDELMGNLPLAAALRERARCQERRADALRQMPTMLDVVTLGLSAGLSFDSSLELYCTRYDTELADAVREAMLTWRIGARSRTEALEALADDLDVSSLRRFSAAVSQALAFGSPLAQALEQQAQAIRDEQRAELEAEIERVPVKMLIPLGTLIVPAMLLAILGPLLGSSIGMA